MEAVRIKKVKRTGRQLRVDLPDDFKAEEMDVIVLPSEKETGEMGKPIDLETWRKSLREEFSKFNVDLSNLTYNREELYDR